MNVDEVAGYQLDLAEADWPVAQHLFASGDYRYAIFFGHEYLEKLLKALVVRATGEHAPKTHNLLLLAGRAGLRVSDGKRDMLVRVTGYSVETRYPGEAMAARKRYTMDYAHSELGVIREAAEWLRSELTQKKK